MILKLDVRLQTPISTSPYFVNASLQIFQTPYNPINVFQQSILIKNCISSYQGSLPSQFFSTINALAKSMEILANENSLLTAKICTFYKANKAFNKCQKAKKICVKEKHLKLNKYTILWHKKRQRSRFDAISVLKGVIKMRGN